ncbi:hypothetical protein GCM10022232_87120 [Streptomyces plumbiresistens]|uniref:Uncharacterized protein n=1 Tax=Streptomyces plumbiresistens TaxID=511811 RepID=A0ABP7TL14_9ACTN
MTSAEEMPYRFASGGGPLLVPSSTSDKPAPDALLGAAVAICAGPRRGAAATAEAATAPSTARRDVCRVSTCCKAAGGSSFGCSFWHMVGGSSAMRRT